MKRILSICILALLTSVTFAGQLCHVPPGNPDNFHTIKVKEDRACTHLGHGDLLGSCNDSLDELCDDSDACTIDHDNQVCIADGPVDCDDQDPNTADSCDSIEGCQYVSLISCPCYTEEIIQGGCTTTQNLTLIHGDPNFSSGITVESGVATISPFVTNFCEIWNEDTQTGFFTRDMTDEEAERCFQILCDNSCSGTSLCIDNGL